MHANVSFANLGFHGYCQSTNQKLWPQIQLKWVTGQP